MKSFLYRTIGLNRLNRLEKAVFSFLSTLENVLYRLNKACKSVLFIKGVVAQLWKSSVVKNKLSERERGGGVGKVGGGGRERKKKRIHVTTSKALQTNLFRFTKRLSKTFVFHFHWNRHTDIAHLMNTELIHKSKHRFSVPLTAKLVPLR